ncbi:hypothetical protein [Streptomyces sp. NPDC085659]|uniref:hypothetical protein n=1 Tax=Streptomyces sp. NPDC085659 TaxID=3155177 RepID=UPI00344F6B8F
MEQPSVEVERDGWASWSLIGETNQERRSAAVGTGFPSETDRLVPVTTLYSNLTAEDLTLGDVDALVSYLTLRLTKAKKGVPYDGEAYRALRTVEYLLTSQAEDTRTVFAAAPVTKDLLEARLRQWNKVTRLAYAWQQDDDYSHRWGPVRHRDAAEAAEEAARKLSRL